MDKDLIIAVILGILIIVGVVQGIELNSLREKISTGNINLQATTNGNGQSTADSTPSSNIGMVGGC
ncbi:MAG: hypothetical protein AB1571_00430 [Nanoarchaeota archaeon]